MSSSLRLTPRVPNPKVLLAFAAIYLIWGTTYLAIRVAVETVPPFLMAGLRFLVAGTITFAILRARGVPMPGLRQVRSAAIIGVFLLVGGNGLVTWSEEQVPSGIAALVVATMPLWMALLEWLFYHGVRPSGVTVAGLLLGFAGTGSLLGFGQGHVDVDAAHLIVLFLAPVLWSIGSLHSRRLDKPDNVFMLTALEMLFGGVILLGMGVATGEPARLQLETISTRSLLSMLYLVVFGSIVALTAYAWLLKNVHVHKISTYTYVNPIIAVFMGWLVLDEVITTNMLVAIAAIIVSVVLITMQRRIKDEPVERASRSPEVNALPAVPSTHRT